MLAYLLNPSSRVYSPQNKFNMDDFLKDLDTHAFGHALHQILIQYGFGVLSKSDLEAALYHALCIMPSK